MRCFGAAREEFGSARGTFGDFESPETPPAGFEPRPKRLAWSQQPNLYLEPKWLRYFLWWLGWSPQPLKAGSQTTPVGFEPTRGDPIGLAGRRLSRSAKVSVGTCVRQCQSPFFFPRPFGVRADKFPNIPVRARAEIRMPKIQSWRFSLAATVELDPETYSEAT